MKIFIVGLGLIGASYAEGLHNQGHKIYAYNRTERPVLSGIAQGFIEPDNALAKMRDCDVIILALYPKHNIEFIQTHRQYLRSGQLITDVSGTKVWMMQVLESILPKTVTYTSHHPMAGKEKSGFDAKDPNMFVGANLIIVTGSMSAESDKEILQTIANDLKFGKLLVTDANTHDQLIAFTSQLTHVLAVTLVQTDHLTQTKEATGDSYRDLTRIAKINETMWSELFLENKDALVSNIDRFMQELNDVKDMIQREDKDALMLYLKAAKEKRKTFDIL